MKRRIGLFGGSFDPPHRAHVALAQLALRQLALDELRWVPTGMAWHKVSNPTSAQHRAAMVALAIGDEPRFRLERCELERPGPSYTLDTVCQLQAAEPAGTAADWLLIIGEDQYADLHRWVGWRELLARVQLAVAGRPGERPVDAEVAAFPCLRLALPPMEVSSTEVRRRLASGLPIDDLVPAAVARYIESNRLYLPGGGIGS